MRTSALSILRGTVGVVAAGVGCVGIPLLLFTWFYGASLLARGEPFQRLLLGEVLLILAAFAVAAVALSDAPWRSIVRSSAVWLAGTLLVAGFLWVGVVMDSMRPVLGLPEAELTYPGATEISRWTGPADPQAGVGASLVRGFLTEASWDEIKTFYVSDLGAAGWVGPNAITDGEMLEWHRDGFILRIGVPVLPWIGRYESQVVGPLP